MIKINLATRKQAAFVAEGKAKGAGFDLGMLKNFRFDAEFMREVPVPKLALTILFIFVAQWFVDDRMASALAELDERIQAERAKVTRLNTEVAKTKGFEKLKEQLDKDEFTMRTKVEALREIRDYRHMTPSMFLVLSENIPNESWLSDFSLGEGKIQIGGFAADYDYVSDLMRRLGESVYFGELSLDKTSQDRDASGNVLTSFTIMGTRELAKTGAAGAGK